MIFEDIGSVIDGSTNGLSFDLLIENPTSEDVLTEIEADDFAVHLARNPEDPNPLQIWRVRAAGLADREQGEAPARIIVGKQAKTIVTLKYRNFKRPLLIES